MDFFYKKPFQGFAIYFSFFLDFSIYLLNIRLSHQPPPWDPLPLAPPQAPLTLAGSPPLPPASPLPHLIQEGSPTGMTEQQVLAKVWRCLQQILEETGGLHLLSLVPSVSPVNSFLSLHKHFLSINLSSE